MTELAILIAAIIALLAVIVGFFVSTHNRGK
jgi:uncharacterized protein YneF (UPF0154 family)